MSLRPIARLAALALVCAPALALAEAPRRAVTELTAAERATAVQSIRSTMQQRYVFADRRAAIAARLDQAQRTGRYDTADPVQFAEWITDDLRAVTKDLHLSLAFDANGYAAALAPPRSAASADALRRRAALRAHHGLVEMRRLPGNIRYLRISQFYWVPDETGAAYDEAMRFLRDGDAIIIDLRGNPGGSHPAVQYRVSHFLAPNTLELTLSWGTEPPVQSRALEHVPAGRLIGKPLCVLIDGGVGSAAEAFAYDVQQFKLGELVGAKTAGAANNNGFVPIAPAFLLSISEGRPVHAVSNGNWEGTGVAPTVETAPAVALETAVWHALDRLARAAGATPEARAEYAWPRTAVEARLRPPVVPPARLAALAGRYGEHEVTLRDGALWLARSPRPARRLVPLTADGLFALEGADHLRARLTGKVLELLADDAPAPRVLPRR